MESRRRVKLSIVDDHDILRECLVEKLSGYPDFDVVGSFSSGRPFLDDLAGNPADVAIVDFRLPDYEGPILIRELLDLFPDIGVVALTMCDHTRFATEATHAGARGFVIKGAPFEELILAIRAVAEGGSYICREISARLKLQHNQGRDAHTVDELSDREFEVLTMMGRGLSQKEIAARLSISDKSVGTYRKRLMDKLGLETQADLIRLAIEADVVT